MVKRHLIHTITGKLFIQLAVVLGFIICLTSFVSFGIMDVAKQETYQRMRDQSNYYLETLDKQLAQIKEQQINCMNDWDLINLSVNYEGMSGYERRSALLALRERMNSFENSFNIIDRAALYIWDSGHVITGASVRRMTDEDRETVKRLEKLNYYQDDTGLYLIEEYHNTAAERDYAGKLCVIHISRKRMEQEMGRIMFGMNSGIFFLSQDGGITFHKGENPQLSERIATNLKKNDEGYWHMQTVYVDGRKYLCTVSEQAILETFVQYTQQDVVMQEISRYQKWLWGIWICIAVAIVFIIILVRRQIHRPVNTLLEAFLQVREGKLGKHIHYEGKDEFQSLYDGFNEMQDQMHTLIDRLAEQKILTQKAQLKQLQAQINPHFLYNSFFVLSRRIKREDYENALNFAQLLGEYFKFVTRNDSDDICLREEVEHARCYARIQGTRFINRIEVEFGELPEEYAGIYVPRLVIQPLLENAFEHGLENKIADGILRVSFEKKQECLCICVEDNGDEIDTQTVEWMNQKIEKGVEEQEITGIVNIHKRLQLYFYGKAGLRAEIGRLGGIKMVLWIPEKNVI